MNGCIENIVIFDMSVCTCSINLPVAVLNYLLCHYTKEEGFRTMLCHILSFLYLCLVRKAWSYAYPGKKRPTPWSEDGS